MEDCRKFATTFSGISCLQLPALISRAQKGSTLARFQSFGFPLNMSKKFMKHHFSFSPGNMNEGRYYTLVTSLFNHADFSHLLTNLMILASSGRSVHKEIGRLHFLSVFLGGGIAGNFAMWLHYMLEKTRLQNGLMNPSRWPLLGDTAIGYSLDQGKKQILSSSFESFNSWLSCIGCSACVSAIVSLEACITLETLFTRLRQAIHRNMHRRHGGLVEEDLNLVYDLTRLVLTCSFAWTDLQALFGNGDGAAGFFSYTFSTIAHSGHLGGFLFGILYYFFCRR